jgi:hypothetical protein
MWLDRFIEELRKRTEKAPFLRVAILVLPFLTGLLIAWRVISGEASAGSIILQGTLTVIYGYVAWRVVKGPG